MNKSIIVNGIEWDCHTNSDGYDEFCADGDGIVTVCGNALFDQGEFVTNFPGQLILDQLKNANLYLKRIYPEIYQSLKK